nr:hypothetical protein [Haladaptatus sp. R4]
MLEETGYHGISESEFVYDRNREEYVLLDINTRPWKWISLPVQAGADLPGAAYAEATGKEFEFDGTHDATWVYLADYLKLLASDSGFSDVLSDNQWESLLSGRFERERDLTTGVYRPSDVGPVRRLMKTEFGGTEYYCSC